MFARKRAVDLGLLVVVLQLRKIDHFVAPGVLRLAIDLEHHLVGFEQHFSISPRCCRHSTSARRSEPFPVYPPRYRPATVDTDPFEISRTRTRRRSAHMRPLVRLMRVNASWRR